jgi:hypothetical protein
MKRVVTLLAVLAALGCSSVRNVADGDSLRNAALRQIGAEQVAWLSHNSDALPRGMESVVRLKKMRAFIDDINSTNGTVTTTYWYTGTFETPEGNRDGTLTVQRRLHFQRDDSGNWKQSAPPEEIARNSQWSSGRAAS